MNYRNRSLHTKNNTLAGALLSLLAVMLPGASVQASLVHLTLTMEDGSVETGAGYSVRKGSECFIVTPAHVVEFADEIRVIDLERREVGAKTIKLHAEEDIDVALLKVTEYPSITCEENWTNAQVAKKALLDPNVDRVVVRRSKPTGGFAIKRLNVDQISGDRIDLFPISDRDHLIPGDSGSSVFIGSTLVGMVVSVETRDNSVKAVSQAMIDGLFRQYILKSSKPLLIMKPITSKRGTNVYATDEARRYFKRRTSYDIAEPNSQQELLNLMTSAKFVVSGSIVNMSSVRQANPDYRAAKSRRTTAKKTLVDEVHDVLASGGGLAPGSNKASSGPQYFAVYTVDVEFQIKDLEKDKTEKFFNSSEKRFTYGGDTVRQKKSAIRNSITNSLRMIMEEHPNLASTALPR